jgi:uncharacterized protein YcfJ
MKMERRHFLLGSGALALGACQANPSPQLGLVRDPQTGLSFGSVVERHVVFDANQVRDRRLGVFVRNTSGDTAFDMSRFATQIGQSYASRGFQPVDGADYGLRVDVNVVRSSQISESYMAEFGFLGAAAGGIAGRRSQTAQGTAIGVVAGATLGAILGSYVTNDTFIVISAFTLTVFDTRTGTTQRGITFEGSPRMVERDTDFRPARMTIHNQFAVFAGGRMTTQAQVADHVRQRAARIAADLI